MGKMCILVSYLVAHIVPCRTHWWTRVGLRDTLVPFVHVVVDQWTHWAEKVHLGLVGVVHSYRVEPVTPEGRTCREVPEGRWVLTQ